MNQVIRIRFYVFCCTLNTTLGFLFEDKLSPSQPYRFKKINKPNNKISKVVSVGTHKQAKSYKKKPFAKHAQQEKIPDILLEKFMRSQLEIKRRRSQTTSTQF